jgi:O-antigen/teichoic acid export membrane protein
MSSYPKIVKNLIALTFSEFANKGIVFLSSIYLMRTIAPEGNGAIAYANSFYVFFQLLVMLAFHTIGSREIAKYPEKIKQYADTITSSRLLISFFVFIVYAAVLFSIGNLTNEQRIATLITGVMLFSSALNMDWIFQGIERMEVLAVRQVSTSAIILAGYFIFVHSRADLFVAVGIVSASNILNALWLFVYYSRKISKFNFHIDKSLLIDILKSALPLTIYTFSVTVLNQANIMIMKHYNFSETQLGLFNSAFKIVQFVIIPSGIIQMAFYPALSRCESLIDRRNIFKKYSTMNIVLGALLTLSVAVIPEYIIGLFLGKEYAPVAPYLRIYVFSGLLVYFNTSLTPVLIAWKEEKKVMWSISFGSIFSLIANLALIPLLGLYGAVYSSIVGEAFICLFLSISMYKTIQTTVLRPALIAGSILILSVISAMKLSQLGLHPLIYGAISPIIFIICIFLTKTVKINDIKGLMKR